MAWYCKLHVWCCFWPNACPVFATYTSALLSIAFFFVFFLCLVYFTYYAILWYYYWMYLKIFHSCVAVNAFIKGQLFERSRASLDFSGDPVLECMLTWELSWVHCVSEKKKKFFLFCFFVHTTKDLARILCRTCTDCLSALLLFKSIFWIVYLLYCDVDVICGCWSQFNFYFTLHVLRSSLFWGTVIAASVPPFIGWRYSVRARTPSIIGEAIIQAF